MKKWLGTILVTLLVMVTALGSMGVLSDFEPLTPLATFESDVEAMLTPEVAPAGDILVLTTLTDELVTSDAVDSVTIILAVLGTSVLGLTLVFIWMTAKPRSSRRRLSGMFSGRVVFHRRCILPV